MNEYQKPYTFRAGTYAKSSEVNADFDTLKDYVNELKDYVEDILISSAPYNKANLNGSPTETFQVKDGESANDAVNYGQFAGLESRVQDLEEINSIEAPTYNNGTTISDDVTIASNGVLVVKAQTGSQVHSIVIDGTEFSMAAGCLATFPVKNGTTIGAINYMQSVKLYT